MIYLRQSTAGQEVIFGIMVDSTDGNTEETGLTIANTDIKIWKAGATTLVDKNSGGATHISNAIYYAVFDATDSNTLGSGKAFIHVSGALYSVIEFCVLPANIYDSWILGTDYMQVDSVQIEGSDATNQITASVPTAVQLRTEMDSYSTRLSDIVADTNELQTDWHNGGRLDLLLDASIPTGVVKVYNGTGW